METLIDILNNIFVVLFIVFFFGFCIFIHEFGHLLAAIWMKLHVDKFSIGFGKKLWGIKYKGIDFIISLLPLGGYVSIPQLEPGEVPKTEDGRELSFAGPVERAVTAFAGPFFNILFGFVLATILWVSGVWKTPPATSVLVTDVPRVIPVYGSSEGVATDERIVAINGQPVTGIKLKEGEYEGSLYDLCCFWDEFPAELKLPQEDGVLPMTVRDKNGQERDVAYSVEFNPEYIAGLRAGDRIVKFNGKGFRKGVEGLMEECAYNESPEATLTLVRDGNEPFDVSFVQKGNTRVEELKIPFFQARNPMTVGDVLLGTPMSEAGLRKGDQLLAYNGKPMMTVRDFLDYVKTSESDTLSLTVCRHEQEMTLPVSLPVDRADITAEKLGIAFIVVIKTVFQDSPADRAGLQTYDRLLKLNGTEVTDVRSFSAAIRALKGAPLTLTLLRDGQEIMVENVEAKFTDASGEEHYMLGVQLDDTPPKIIMHPSPWEQFTDVFSKTARTLWLLFQPVTSFVTGRESGSAPVKLKHMSSFVGISAMLWYTVKTEGIRGGLAFIILISFGLAFANLLPFPILDGGHIMFACIEFVIRRRLPQKFVSVVSNIFAGLLIALMLYITFNDILRLPKIGRAYSNEKPKLELLTPSEAPNHTPEAGEKPATEDKQP